MSKGFYRYGNDPEEVMLSVIIDRERDVDAWSYLHGMCGVFALALSQEFGYPIWIIQDSKDDPVLESLIHVFCVVNNADGQKQYIDARGVTTNEDRFLRSFGKFFDSPVYREFMPKEVELLMKDDLGTAYEYFLDCAKKLISLHQVYYEIKEEKAV